MKISLHLGVHKTASTFMQDAFAAGQGALAAQQVAHVPTTEFRRSFTRLLRPGPAGDADVAARQQQGAEALAAYLAATGAPRILLSDENLIGTPPEIVESQRLYPSAGTRLAAFARLLEGHEVEIFVALRHHGQFARSVYGESLRSNLRRFVSPDAFRDGWLAGEPSWLSLIEAVCAAFPNAPVTVWNFLDFKKDPQRFLNLVAGLDPAVAFDTTQANHRPSLSHDAVEALVEIGATRGVKAMRAVLDDVSRAHPRSEGNWQYRLWTPEQERDFNRAFRRDLNRIAALGGQVRLVGADG
ncbi:MAG: hypothetical protein HUJ24_07465 [Rhodobacteraceae bacterium]|nr:hypothetical protein [Paracoccaceae bacterium]